MNSFLQSQVIILYICLSFVNLQQSKESYKSKFTFLAARVKAVYQSSISQSVSHMD